MIDIEEVHQLKIRIKDLSEDVRKQGCLIDNLYSEIRKIKEIKNKINN